jgi:hypothetical protein
MRVQEPNFLRYYCSLGFKSMPRSAAPRIGMPQPPPCPRHGRSALVETRELVRAHKILPRRGVGRARPGTRRRPRGGQIWYPYTPPLWLGRCPDGLGWRVRKRNLLRRLTLVSEQALSLSRSRSALDSAPIKQFVEGLSFESRIVETHLSQALNAGHAHVFACLMVEARWCDLDGMEIPLSPTENRRHEQGLVHLAG